MQATEGSSGADLCCSLTRTGHPAATVNKKYPLGSSQCCLITRNATLRKRDKCVQLVVRKVKSRHKANYPDISNLPVHYEWIHQRRETANSTPFFTFRATQFPPSASSRDYRYSVKDDKEIQNPHQHWSYQVYCLFPEVVSETFSRETFNVSSQTKHRPHKNKDEKQTHRRKRGSRGNNGSNSGENKSQEGGSESRRNGHSSRTTTHGVNNVVTTQVPPDLLNETLYSLLKSLYPDIQLPEGTAHWFIHRRTTTERQHTWAEHDNNRIGSTANYFPWTNVEETSAPLADAGLNIISTTVSAQKDIPEGNAAHSKDTQTHAIGSVTYDNIFADIKTSGKYTMDDHSTADITGGVTIVTNISATNQYGEISDATETYSTINVTTTNMATRLTPEAKGSEGTRKEATDFRMEQSTADAGADKITYNDIVTLDSAILFTTNVAATSTRIIVTDALSTTVTTNDVTTATSTGTDITALAVATPAYNTTPTSSAITETDTSTITSGSNADTTLTTNTTIDAAHVTTATSISDVLQTSSAAASFVSTPVAPSTVATVANTVDLATQTTSDEATAASADVSTASFVDRTPTDVQKPDVLSTNSAITDSAMDEVTPDSRPYGDIEDSTSTYTSKASLPTDNLTTDKISSSTASFSASPNLALGASNITKHPLNSSDTSTSTTISQKAVDTDAASGIATSQRSTLHLLGFGATSRITTRDTATDASVSQDAELRTTDSHFTDVVNTTIDPSSQCSGSPGVACFLEAARKSLQGRTTNTTREQIMDTCEDLLDQIHTEAISRSAANSTNVRTVSFTSFKFTLNFPMFDVSFNFIVNVVIKSINVVFI
ncbi:hypothetical protein BsWGS_00136 [Bradybaena similaris]